EVGQLRAAAVEDVVLSLQEVERVRKETAHDADPGKNRGAGYAVADGEVAHLVHRGAAHPAGGRIRSEGALLDNARRTVWIGQLVPAHAGLARLPTANTNRMVDDERLADAEEIPVGQAMHQPIAQRVELLARIWLGDTGASIATGPVERRDGDVRWAAEGRV